MFNQKDLSKPQTLRNLITFKNTQEKKKEINATVV